VRKKKKTTARKFLNPSCKETRANCGGEINKKSRMKSEKGLWVQLPGGLGGRRPTWQGALAGRRLFGKIRVKQTNGVSGKGVGWKTRKRAVELTGGVSELKGTEKFLRGGIDVCTGICSRVPRGLSAMVVVRAAGVSFRRKWVLHAFLGDCQVGVHLRFSQTVKRGSSLVDSKGRVTKKKRGKTEERLKGSELSSCYGGEHSLGREHQKRASNKTKEWRKEKKEKAAARVLYVEIRREKLIIYDQGNSRGADCKWGLFGKKRGEEVHVKNGKDRWKSSKARISQVMKNRRWLLRRISAWVVKGGLKGEIRG